jgi:hypothetical protein
MTDDEAEEQLRVAAEAIRAAVLRLLREGGVHPRLLVMAAARVAGELGSGMALAGGEDAEAVLEDLAGVVREAGSRHGEMLREIAEMMPVAGNA